jgi:hypothetical protein
MTMQERSKSISKYLENSKKRLKYWANFSGHVYADTFELNNFPQLAKVVVTIGKEKMTFDMYGNATFNGEPIPDNDLRQLLEDSFNGIEGNIQQNFETELKFKEYETSNKGQ